MRLGMMDEPAAIRTCLSAYRGPFCDDCLCGLVGIPADEVKVVIFACAPEFARVYGYCKACRQTKVVTAKLLAA
jgi:hypothetical protein